MGECLLAKSLILPFHHSPFNQSSPLIHPPSTGVEVAVM